MDVDESIEPLLTQMQALRETLKIELMPKLTSEMTEEKLLTEYDSEGQGRLYLSAAFILAFGLYSLDKVQNNKPDQQVVLKIERITEYIKKLKEISQIQKQSHGSGANNGEEELFKMVSRQKSDAKDVVGRLLSHVESHNAVVEKKNSTRGKPKKRERDDETK
ncbi:hypothetical protein ADEAN_000754200 [Angomonas deanei]|uniref:Exosome complex protein n=1 Tax=Angomonas deanei TaxID=59799 RepID=A0A7G2CJI6_9TRYP|nr:hypothetical protein ADEAN_000754200 [Angomonas deanei]